MAGSIPAKGIVEKLGAIEATCTTGVLRWSGAHRGELTLVRGQIAPEQDDREDGEDAVELLLAEREGTFEVFQQLPPLPVSAGDGSRREGSLEVHVAADLMNYCETSGLTGLLVLWQDGGRAEIAYDRGELSDIRLEGIADLVDTFGWESGRFEVRALARMPNLAEDLDDAVTTELVRPAVQAGAETTGKHLLRVVEVTLAEILRDREERRPASRLPTPAPAPRPVTPKASGREPTVRVIYLGGSDAESEGPDVAKKKTKKKSAPTATPAAASADGQDATHEPSDEPASTADRSAEGKDTTTKDAKDAKAATTKDAKDAKAATTKDATTKDAKDAKDAKAATTKDATAKDAKDATTTVGDATKESATKDVDTTEDAKEPKHPAAPVEKPRLPTVVWALISVVVMLVALAAIAALPPVD